MSFRSLQVLFFVLGSLLILPITSTWALTIGEDDDAGRKRHMGSWAWCLLILGMVLGLFLCFFATKWSRIGYSVAAFCSGTGVYLAFHAITVSMPVNQHATQTAVGIAGLIGVAFAIATFFITHLRYLAIGILGGLTGSGLICPLFAIASNNGSLEISRWVLAAIVVIVMIGLCYLAKRHPKTMQASVSGMAGGYITMAGLDCVVAFGFNGPLELVISPAGWIKPVSTSGVWGFFALAIILGLIGARVQLCRVKVATKRWGFV